MKRCETSENPIIMKAIVNLLTIITLLCSAYAFLSAMDSFAQVSVLEQPTKQERRLLRKQQEATPTIQQPAVKVIDASQLEISYKPMETTQASVRQIQEFEFMGERYPVVAEDFYYEGYRPAFLHKKKSTRSNRPTSFLFLNEQFPVLPQEEMTLPAINSGYFTFLGERFAPAPTEIIQIG